MIAIAAYDATIEREGDIYGCHRSVVTPREPVATIRVTVMASGADLDKFMAMLAAVTGEQQADPRDGGREEGDRRRLPTGGPRLLP